MSFLRKKAKILLPSGITFFNWAAGVFSIVLSSGNHFIEATLCIFAAAVFDLFDGMVARTLNATSVFGKEMDSFADSVSFGLAPSFLMFFFLESVETYPDFLKIIVFIPAAAAIVRLALFNSYQYLESDFSGLASPASALFIAGWFFIMMLKEDSWIMLLRDSTLFWVVLGLFPSVLMLLPIKMFSFKLKSFSWQDNQYFYIFLILSVFLILAFHIIALPLVLLLYIILSIFYHFSTKKKQ